MVEPDILDNGTPWTAVILDSIVQLAHLYGVLRFNLVKLRSVNSDPSTSQVTKSKSTSLVDFDETMIYHYWTCSDRRVIRRPREHL